MLEPFFIFPILMLTHIALKNLTRSYLFFFPMHLPDTLNYLWSMDFFLIVNLKLITVLAKSKSELSE